MGRCRHGDGSSVCQLFAFFGTKEELNIENQRFLCQLFVKPCYTHVTPMSHPCCTHVTPMSHPCRTRVAPMLHPCHTHVSKLSANCLSMSLAFQCETCIMGIVEGQKERGPEKRNREMRNAGPGERNREAAKPRAARSDPRSINRIEKEELESSASFFYALRFPPPSAERRKRR